MAVALAAPVKAKRASVCKQEREQQILGMNVEQILEQEQGILSSEHRISIKSSCIRFSLCQLLALGQEGP